MSADGPEERTAELEERSAERDAEFDALLGDEDHDVAPLGPWMRHDGVDSMNWPEAITVRPVDVKGFKP